MPIFGQVIIGPPGSGKSTFCNAMKQFSTAIGRHTIICNLDPANEDLPYETCDIDIRELISTEQVAKQFNLGPNGCLIYCLEFLEENILWLLNRLKSIQGSESAAYVLIDFPGQIELFTHKDCLRNILKCLEKEGDLRLATLHLVDVHYCADAAKFISVLLIALNTMLRLETPHLNILSKMDLYERFEDKMLFDLDYFSDVLDLRYLLDCIDDDPFLAKFKQLNEGLCDTVQSYGLVHFILLNIQDKFSMAHILREADKANGYCFHELQQRQLSSLIEESGPTDITS